MVNTLQTMNTKGSLNGTRLWGLKVDAKYVSGLIDMHRLNCLVWEEPGTFGEVITLIDYEMSCLMPRGVDLGGIFFYFVIDISKESWLRGFPCEAIRREYVQSHTDEVAKLNFIKLDQDGLDSVDHVLMEAEFYSMLFSMYFVTFLMQPNEYVIKCGVVVQFAVRILISLIC